MVVMVLAGFGQISAQDISSVNHQPSTTNSSRTYDQFFMEAMVQRQKGNNDAAFDLLRHCQELNPKAPEVYYFLAQYYMALRNQEKATECVK